MSALSKVCDVAVCAIYFFVFHIVNFISIYLGIRRPVSIYGFTPHNYVKQGSVTGGPEPVGILDI